MAWSWSHTDEAYDYAQQQMEGLDRDTREIIACEWLATPPDEFGGSGFSHLDLRKYHHSTVRVKSWDDEKLNGYIWSMMEDESRGRTCSNGGWEAWCCPHGCHTVPFKPYNVPAHENPAYRVEVKGIGTLFRSHDRCTANVMFSEYVDRSKTGLIHCDGGPRVSKCYGKTVTLYETDTILNKYTCHADSLAAE